ncbi:hypothetical protein MXB_3958 [Myxobolus squamalis]|nr:hypothetical protein MXB_3958 [Myxobolus squamalis]
MGCAISPELRDARNKDKEISKELKKGSEDSQAIVKLLLLGAGESGKSTVFKQISGYTPEELEGFKVIIYENVIKFLDTLIATARIKNIELTKEYWEVQTWKIKEVANLVQEAERYHLNMSTIQLIMNLERISTDDYIPSDEDILLSRVVTTGIKQMSFSYKDTPFEIYDVGGQRSERRKWVHCFENVNAMIFCVSLSDYDQFLVEDDKTNRMGESLKLLNSLLNNPWFEKASIILFLNKTDLLEKKLQHTPLTVCFPEYTGLNTFDDAKEFIRKQFESLNKNKSTREIYTHFTCATDTNQMSAVFEAVTDIIMKKNLRDYGLY